MTSAWLADLVVLIHAAFVGFAVAGGLLVLWRPWIAWLHVPAAAWAALIEFGGWICPLTPLENTLRERAGEAAYNGGFVQHYVVGTLYPRGLTRPIQLVLGCFVLAVNTAIYVVVIRRRRSGSAASAG
jgi:hypothetical protein